jgi:hypothetical protein
LPAPLAEPIQVRSSKTCVNLRRAEFQTHKMKTSQRKSSLAYTPASPQKRFWLFSKQDSSASGFAWVAREPKLMCGAKGARILTEINRLPQLHLLTPAKNLAENQLGSMPANPLRPVAQPPDPGPLLLD